MLDRMNRPIVSPFSVMLWIVCGIAAIQFAAFLAAQVAMRFGAWR